MPTSTFLKANLAVGTKSQSIPEVVRQAFCGRFVTHNHAHPPTQSRVHNQKNHLRMVYGLDWATDTGGTGAPRKQ